MKRVLFVCVENSSRGQMAGAFAWMHGAGSRLSFAKEGASTNPYFSMGSGKPDAAPGTRNHEGEP